MNVAVKFLHSELMEADVTALEEFQVRVSTCWRGPLLISL